MRSLLLAVVVVLFASSAVAQEKPSLSRSLTAALKDPTTWAPAGIGFVAKKLDWDSSQRLFALGSTEMNPRFTINGQSDAPPISFAAGNRIILRRTAVVAAESYTHNVIAVSIDRALQRRFPAHRRLVSTLGWIERLAFASGRAYLVSAASWRAWRTNLKMLNGYSGR
jgi:hypothetical protein